jgi:raffinose/stachyose/melibiose transport system permease protein
MRGDRLLHAGIQALLLLNALFMLIPILFMVFGAFRTNAELFSSPFSIPDRVNLDNLQQVWRETNFVQYLANSVLITTASVAVLLAFGTAAAYAIARYQFRFRDTILLFFVCGLMVPLKLAIIPLFVQLDWLGLIDTRAGLVLIYVAMGLPSAVFILTGFLRALPGELEEAARIEGATEARILWTVMLPLARPALVIAGIQNAVPIWNDFFFPLVFITTDRLKTLPQGLTVFMGEFNTDWGVLFAGLTLSALPITLCYIVLSRQFIAGLTQGAVK